MSGGAEAASYIAAENRVFTAANGIDYAHRSTGGGEARPLVLLNHIRGNLDNWDPELIDALAAGRHVITFDNRGVGASTLGMVAVEGLPA
jgi:pimeloyl-ACP methyl ester carboxylesterase